ncbi:RDD family protein [Streptomyces albogriseolus]|uniref:RDD family protein n=1 Tax=Streptomyces TaxID=1883 RepID=UPI001E30CEBB|nr:RDD family protein [Streptomyces sp. DH20]
MTTEPPPGPGQQPPDEDPFRKQPPPDDDPFRKQPPPGAPGSPYDTPGGPPPPGQGGSGPYEGGGASGTYGGGGAGGPYGGSGGPYGGGPGGPYGGGPGGGPYGGGPGDPLAGMPPLADSARRTLARIIDMILVGVVVWLLTWPVGVSEYNFDGDRVNVGNGFAQSVIAAALYIAYDTFMAVRYGRTLGKKWLGLRVANLADGSNPSVQTALVRAAVLWLPFAFCCACVWTAIAGGWSYFDRPYKQGLHDKAARTVVVTAQ